MSLLVGNIICGAAAVGAVAVTRYRVRSPNFQTAQTPREDLVRLWSLPLMNMGSALVTLKLVGGVHPLFGRPLALILVNVQVLMAVSFLVESLTNGKNREIEGNFVVCAIWFLTAGSIGTTRLTKLGWNAVSAWGKVAQIPLAVGTVTGGVLATVASLGAWVRWGLIEE